MFKFDLITEDSPELAQQVKSLRLKRADAREVAAFSVLDTPEVISQAMKDSVYVWAISDDKEVVGVCGLSEGGGWGIPWLLTSESINKQKKLFARLSKQALEQFLELYPNLCNFVDYRHKTTLRWLRWLGFKIEETNTRFHDPLVPFYRFYISREG